MKYSKQGKKDERENETKEDILLGERGRKGGKRWIGKGNQGKGNKTSSLRYFRAF